MRLLSSSREDLLLLLTSSYSQEKAMATHSSTLAWKIPWMEEPGRLQSMGSLQARHNWATYFPFSLSCIGEGNGNPLQCSCLENPRDSGAWWAAVYGVAQTRTWMKWLSSSSSSRIQWCNWYFYIYSFRQHYYILLFSHILVADSLELSMYRI